MPLFVLYYDFKEMKLYAGVMETYQVHYFNWIFRKKTRLFIYVLACAMSSASDSEVTNQAKNRKQKL